MTEPEARPRSLLGRCILTGGLCFAAIGAVGGLTGAILSEYQASPVQHAIIVGINVGFYGLVIGFVVGVVANLVRWWL
jgi:hypothetical protein